MTKCKNWKFNAKFCAQTRIHMLSPNTKLFPNLLQIQTIFYRLVCSNKATSNRY